jgi:hypothetical protein
MKGKPFALLGVNSDTSLKNLKAFEPTDAFPGRSWWDGGIGGLLARTWQVPGWPACFVLDQRGVIRFVHVTGKELDRAVDELMQQLTPSSS